MANEQVYKFKYIGDMDISKIKTSIENLQKNLSSLKIPATALSPFERTVKSLSEELKNFQVLTSKTSTDKSGMAAIERSYEKIDKLIEKIGVDLEDVGRKGFDKLIPKQAADNIKEMATQMKKFQSIQESNEKKQIDINDRIKEWAKLEERVAEKEKELLKIKKEINELEKNYNPRSGEKASYEAELKREKGLLSSNKSLENYNKTKEALQQTEEALKNSNKEAKALEQSVNKAFEALQKLKNQTTSKTAQNYNNEKEKLENTLKTIEALKQQKIQQEEVITTYEKTKERIENLTQKINEINNSTNDYNNKQSELQAELKKTQSELEKEEQKFDKLQEDLSKLKFTDFTKDLDAFRQKLAEIKGVDISKIPTDLKELNNVVKSLTQSEIDKIARSFKDLSKSQEELSRSSGEIREKINQEREAFRSFDQRMREIDSIKRRITAFFGLNNAIMLARRALRSAFNTVKELDKAMTETAVVTNFSVGDMWSQLPEYTKRANELGVTTLEAYQASTLFYQQGLKTNEVVALSNETLKMARIAGLDAAEATDRMTNALRGFNMTLTETNAQRIDDVYSKLAAITASNVDEISTAMTKVASLAHNANMEFETTSAFLAQIIETTRESAETAGTALKTVVARFSEVKDLYTKEQLTGTDEEGEVIDVNKISKALRTAGIDLSRYFLGVVGLDDIFMELAEKWDSLTNVQQRYIATQAAGSRQQSRFIALMSDYARTQELVGAAYSANGAAAEQFEKTQSSLQSKLARLKNAWDEFTMGLANSTLIKTGVDLLTGVLKVVNKLTTGFGLLSGKVGNFVSALLKIGTVMGIRSLARGPAAMLVNSLGSIIGIGGVSNREAYLRAVFRNDSGAMTGLQNASWRSILAYQYGSPLRNILNRRNIRADSFTKYSLTRLGFNVIGGYENARDLTKFETTALSWGSKGFGKTKLAKGLGAKLAPILGMGTSSAGAQAAAGLVSMGVALVGVAAAATAAYGAIKMLYEASPEGQIKYAEQVKSEIDYTKSSLEATKKTVDETLDSYNQQLDSLSKLEKGTTEWANAFIEVNKTVSDLIERFPELVKYVETTSDGLLMIDQKGLAEYQKKLNEQIGKYSALSIMATGGVAQRKAITSQGAEAIGQEYLAEASFVAAAKSLAKGQYSEEIYKAFAKNFDFNKWAKDAGREAGSGTGRFLGIGTGGGTKKQLRDTYKELTGQEADENWNKNQLKDAIGQFNNTDEIENYLQTISDILNKIAEGQNNEENKQTATDILQGVNNQEAREFADGLTDSIFGSQELKDNIRNKVYDTIASGRGSGLGYSREEIDTVKQNFERAFNWYKEISNLTDEEIFSAVQKDTIAEAGLEILRLIFESASEFDLTKEQVSEALTGEYGEGISKKVTSYLDSIEGLTNEQYSKLAPVFAELQSRGIDVARTFGELSPEAAEILTSLDMSDPDIIKMVFNALDDMGVKVDQEVINKLVGLASAADAAAKSLEKIDESTDLAKRASELRDRESFTFNKEEYDKYGQYDPENFYRISEDLWVYLEDDFSKLIKGLEEASIKGYRKTKGALNKAIAAGEQWEKLKLAGNSDENLRAFFGGAASEYETAYLNLNANRRALNQLDNGLGFYGLNKNLSVKDTKSVAAKFKANMDKELLTYYDSISDSLDEQDEKAKELLGTEEEREAWAQKTALQYRDTIQEYNNLLSVIEANKDNLLIEDTNSQFYKNAVSEISREIQEMYGLSEQAADKFVDEHKDAIIAATETEEGFQDFLKLIAQAWRDSNIDMIQSAATAMNGTVGQVESMLDQVADAVSNFDGEIGIDVDTEGILNRLSTLGIDIQSFMKSLGVELVTEPYNVTVPNPGLAMENVFRQMGIESPNLHMPETIQVQQFRMVWKPIGTADTNGFGGGGTPPGGSTPPKTEEPTPVDLAKEAYDTNQTNIDYWEAKGDKEKVKELLLASPGLIMEIVAALRKETGKDFENFYSTEVQENDPNEVIEWLTNWIQAVTEAEEYNKEPEKTKEEEANAAQERLDLLKAEGAPQEEIEKQLKLLIELFEELYKNAKEEGKEGEAADYKEQAKALQEELDALTAELPRDFQKEISELEATLELRKLQGASPEEQAEIINQMQNIYHEWAEYLRSLPEYTGIDDETIKKLSIAWWQLEEQEKELLTPPPKEKPEVVTWLIDPDRYYNLNNLIERLIDTGEDLSESLQKSLGDADSSGNQILKNFVSLLDAYLKELQSEKYKGEALRVDRDTLDTQFADVFAAGLVERLEDGTLVNLVENIEQLEADDQELYERYEDFMSKNDDIENNIKSNEDAIKNVQNKIEDLKNTYEQLQSAYIDLVKRVVDAIVTLQQEAIDTQKEIYSSLNETARNILDGMREQIALERQIRDNTKTEEEIKDLESRLAYLRRDTTGANAQEILKLEKQIEQKREGYQDKLVDQRLQELQKQQQEEEKNRNKQIEAMQETLNEQVKQGAFNNQAEEIIAGAIDENGKIISNSELVELLSDAENWDTLTDEQRAQIDQALDKEVNLAAAWLMSKDGGFAKFAEDYLGEGSPLYQWLTGGGSDENGLPRLFKTVADAAQGITEKYAEVGGTLNGIEQKLEILKNGESDNDGSSAKNDSSKDHQEFILNEIRKEALKYVGRPLDDYLTKKERIYPWFNRSTIGYASGGLNTKTGPAWLDGTPSNPEYVLNAAQTQAFLRLAEVLPSIMRGNTPNNEDSIKNIYLNLTMNVDEIGNDYDVDKIVKRVKEVLYEAGTYRNVNMLSLN